MPFLFDKNLNIDYEIIQSIIDDNKQKMCPINMTHNGSTFIDLVLLRNHAPCDTAQVQIPISGAESIELLEFPFEWLPQNQQTAINSLLTMGFTISAVLNRDLSMESHGPLIAELYANLISE